MIINIATQSKFKMYVYCVYQNTMNNTIARFMKYPCNNPNIVTKSLGDIKRKYIPMQILVYFNWFAMEQ